MIGAYYNYNSRQVDTGAQVPSGIAKFYRVPLTAYTSSKQDALDIVCALCDNKRRVRVIVERCMNSQCAMCKLYATDTQVRVGLGCYYVNFYVAMRICELKKDELLERIAEALETLATVLRDLFRLSAVVPGDSFDVLAVHERVTWSRVAYGCVHDLVLACDEQCLQDGVLAVAKLCEMAKDSIREKCTGDDKSDWLSRVAFFRVLLVEDIIAYIDDDLPAGYKEEALAWLGQEVERVFSDVSVYVKVRSGERRKLELLIRATLLHPATLSAEELDRALDSQAYYTKKALGNFVAGVEISNIPPSFSDWVNVIDYINK